MNNQIMTQEYINKEAYEYAKIFSSNDGYEMLIKNHLNEVEDVEKMIIKDNYYIGQIHDMFYESYVNLITSNTFNHENNICDKCLEDNDIFSFNQDSYEILCKKCTEDIYCKSNWQESQSNSTTALSCFCEIDDIFYKKEFLTNINLIANNEVLIKTSNLFLMAIDRKCLKDFISISLSDLEEKWSEEIEEQIEKYDDLNIIEQPYTFDKIITTCFDCGKDIKGTQFAYDIDHYTSHCKNCTFKCLDEEYEDMDQEERTSRIKKILGIREIEIEIEGDPLLIFRNEVENIEDDCYICKMELEDSDNNLYVKNSCCKQVVHSKCFDMIIDKKKCAWCRRYISYK